MADKWYRSGALKRKQKNERQQHEKQVLSQMKTITGFFTPVTPQPDVLTKNPEDNNPNPLEETVGADLTSGAGQPINESSSEAVSSLEVATETATQPCTPTTTDSLSTDPARWGKVDESVRAYWA